MLRTALVPGDYPLPTRMRKPSGMPRSRGTLAEKKGLTDVTGVSVLMNQLSGSVSEPIARSSGERRYANRYTAVAMLMPVTIVGRMPISSESNPPASHESAIIWPINEKIPITLPRM